MSTFSSHQIKEYLKAHNNCISAHFFESPAFSHVMDSMGNIPSVVITKGRKATNEPLAIVSAAVPENFIHKTHVYITTHDLRRSLSHLMRNMNSDEVFVVRKGTLHDPKQTVAYVMKPTATQTPSPI